MDKKAVLAGAAVLIAAVLGGCANDGSRALSTGSIAGEEQAKAERVDPVCVALMARIDSLRKEGTPERLAKVADGKSKTASVKREAIARMTELDAANREFQQKCSKLALPQSAAVTAPAAGTAAAPAAAKAAATTAAPAVKKTAAAATTAAVVSTTAAQ